MTRFTSTSMQALSSLDLVAFRLFADVGVTSSTLYFVTGNRYEYTLGNTYTPVGTYGGLGDVSGIQEETDAFPRDVTLQLCIPSSYSIYTVQQESLFNRPVTLRHSFLDVPTMTLVHTPETRWVGRISEVSLYPTRSMVEVRAVTELRRTAPTQFFNRETFRAVDSSDTFANHIDEIPLYKGSWGNLPFQDFIKRLREIGWNGVFKNK